MSVDVFYRYNKSNVVSEGVWVPTPNSNETKKEFIRRCIRVLINEGKPQEQSIAMCYSLWDETSQLNETVIPLEETYWLEGVASNLGMLTTGALTAGPAGIGAAALGIATKTAVGAVSSLIINSLLSKIPQNILDRIKPDSALLSSMDTNSNNNKFRTKPQGVVVCDTVNNPIFPIPYPPLDSVKFNLPDIKDQYQAIYAKLAVDFLPWHYVIEMLNGKYYAFQTRPLDMAFPVTTEIANTVIQENKDKLIPEVQKFLDERPFDLREAIHICILGDTSKDVYLQRIYELIGRVCIGPFLRYFKLPHRTGSRIINFNLGPKFHFSKLDFYLAR